MNPKNRAVAWRRSSNLATRIPQGENIGSEWAIAMRLPTTEFFSDAEAIACLDPALNVGELHGNVAHSLGQIGAIYPLSNSLPH
jgi:hypothetical protein